MWVAPKSSSQHGSWLCPEWAIQEHERERERERDDPQISSTPASLSGKGFVTQWLTELLLGDTELSLTATNSGQVIQEIHTTTPWDYSRRNPTAAAVCTSHLWSRDQRIDAPSQHPGRSSLSTWPPPTFLTSVIQVSESTSRSHAEPKLRRSLEIIISSIVTATLRTCVWRDIRWWETSTGSFPNDYGYPRPCNIPNRTP